MLAFETVKKSHHEYLRQKDDLPGSSILAAGDDGIIDLALDLDLSNRLARHTGATRVAPVTPITLPTVNTVIFGQEAAIPLGFSSKHLIWRKVWQQANYDIGAEMPLSARWR